MHPNLVTLYNLRLADERVLRARRRIQGLDWGDAQAKSIESAKAHISELESRLQEAKLALRSCEQELASVESRMERSTRRLAGSDIHNEHELASVEKELGSLRGRQSELEEKALQLMEEVEQIPKSIETVMSYKQAYTEERERIRAASTLEKAHQEQEIVEATSRWQTLAPQVMAPVLHRYKQIRERSGGLAVSRVVAGACGDCHVTVVASLLRSIIEGNDLVPCQNCNRLLYSEGE